MARALAVLLGVALALAAGPTAATHDVGFRYTVLGYATDGAGRPRPDLTVEVVRDKTGLVYRGDSDRQGLFVVVLRLADDSLGEVLTIRAAGATTRVTVDFDPANHADERGTRVDLAGGRLVERRAWFQPTLARLLGDA